MYISNHTNVKSEIVIHAEGKVEGGEDSIKRSQFRMQSVKASLGQKPERILSSLLDDNGAKE